MNGWISGLVGAAVALSAWGQQPAEPLPDFNQMVRHASMLFLNVHYLRPDFDEKFSRKIIETYAEMLDPSKIYFTENDIRRIDNVYGGTLTNHILGDDAVTVARALHRFYSIRVIQRSQEALSILGTDFNFDGDDYVLRSRKNASRPKNEREMADVWKAWIKTQLLDEMMRQENQAEKEKRLARFSPLPGAGSPYEKLVARYRKIIQLMQNPAGLEEQVNLLLSAIGRSLDPHTDYLGVNTANRFKDEMRAAGVGIGITINAEEEGVLRVAGLVVGGPADKKGELKVNDLILGIDPDNSGFMIDIIQLSPERAADLLRGKEDSILRLRIEPADSPGTRKTIKITRKKVERKESMAKGEIIEMRNEAGQPVRIGVLSLPSFYADMDGGQRNCASDVKQILTRMVREKVRGLVFDLRGNGGGTLEETKTIAGYFIGKGPVVQIKDVRGDVVCHAATFSKPVYTGQMVVLINKLSASASEILAATLQDYGRAVVVGDESTFGKGTVQELIPLEKFLPVYAAGGRSVLLKVTTRKFYRVEGGSTQLQGVRSDIVLPTPTAALELGEAVLKGAMAYDRIAPVGGYKKDKWLQEVLPALKTNSLARIRDDLDMKVLQEDIDRIREKEEANRISLNKEIRRKEISDIESRRKLINDEKKARYVRIALDDQARFKIYRLNLDDINKPELHLADPFKDSQRFLKTRADALIDFGGEPDYPSGWDPELRESILIAADMVELKRQAVAEKQAPGDAVKTVAAQ